MPIPATPLAGTPWELNCVDSRDFLKPVKLFMPVCSVTKINPTLGFRSHKFLLKKVNNLKRLPRPEKAFNVRTPWEILKRVVNLEGSWSNWKEASDAHRSSSNRTR